MENILERLKCCKNRESTNKMYLSVWRKFNNFVIKLDVKPKLWEDRASLFGAALVEDGFQSSTLKSYISAIKRILVDDGYQWDDKKMLLNTLTKACRMVNDRVKTRLPIHKGLLEILLFELERMFQNQPFLEILYKAIFALAYYGMFRIGEITTGTHPVKAKNVHIGRNKDKILMILFTSKTHGLESKPQEVKISAKGLNRESNTAKQFFCPFQIARNYLEIRGNYKSDDEPFFIFRDYQPVKPSHAREILKETLKSVNLDPSFYDCHSFRIGRTGDMVFKYKKTIEEVMKAGRWKSNVVFKYIKNN